ncbi:MAG TPA: hypothetical protein VI937_00485 [Negativicutes bacterium]|nr:hypothetical protein [Negativicutes bacterium]
MDDQLQPSSAQNNPTPIPPTPVTPPPLTPPAPPAELPVEEPEQHDWRPKPKLNTNAIFMGVAGLAILGTIALAVASFTGMDMMSVFKLGSSSTKTAEKAVEYINTNNLAGQPVTLGEVSEESGLVKFKVQIGSNSFDSYASKDGKLLFPTAIDLMAPPSAQ